MATVASGPHKTAGKAKTRSFAWIAAGLAAALALFLFYEFGPQPGRSTAVAAAISIAVLPFVNLSSDKEQEFFSDGITEEITAALAKVPDLKVVARTSAFEFKGKNADIKTMGEQLGATHLIDSIALGNGGRRGPSRFVA